MTPRLARRIAGLLALVLPMAAPAADPTPPQAYRPVGLTLAASLGGGGALGAGTPSAGQGLLEGEILAGYEAGLGMRPELGLLVGLAPGSYVGLRPGLHYSLGSFPFYLRFALDLATPRGSLQMRWLLAGGGAEAWLTDALGGFAEADLGVPLGTEFGMPILLRAGLALRF